MNTSLLESLQSTPMAPYMGLMRDMSVKDKQTVVSFLIGTMEESDDRRLFDRYLEKWQHDTHFLSEDGLEKIALYAHPDIEECTHASRQLADGMWTSKLGPSFDICHSTPYTIQGRLYGMGFCILCRVK